MNSLPEPARKAVSADFLLPIATPKPFPTVTLATWVKHTLSSMCSQRLFPVTYIERPIISHAVQRPMGERGEIQGMGKRNPHPS